MESPVNLRGPERYPSPATCWRRLKEWTEAGIWQPSWTRFLRELEDYQGINGEKAMADGTFAPEKGGEAVDNTKKGRGTKIMLMVDGEGIPLPVFITSANHAEVNTVETLLDDRV